jgi:hypothetical protein
MTVNYWALLIPAGVILFGIFRRQIMFVVFGADRNEAIPKLEKEIKDYDPTLEVGHEIGEKII